MVHCVHRHHEVGCVVRTNTTSNRIVRSSFYTRFFHAVSLSIYWCACRTFAPFRYERWWRACTTKNRAASVCQPAVATAEGWKYGSRTGVGSRYLPSRGVFDFARKVGFYAAEPWCACCLWPGQVFFEQVVNTNSVNKREGSGKNESKTYNCSQS